MGFGGFLLKFLVHQWTIAALLLELLSTSLNLTDLDLFQIQTNDPACFFL